VTLANATDRGVAGHPANVRAPEGSQNHSRTTPRRRRSSLHTSVTGTNDKNVKHGPVLAALALEIKIRVFHVKHYFPKQKRENKA
jgi:hypothetical protein